MDFQSEKLSPLKTVESGYFIMKLNVIGTSGSGKTTLAKHISDILSVPLIEMDQIFWGPNWYWPSDEEFFERLRHALDRESWVLDGNYTRTTPIKWKHIDVVVWIDYSFLRTFYQALERAIIRSLTRKELWPGTGNYETFRKLFSKDSILLWTLKTYRKNRVKYLAMMKDPQYASIEFVHIQSPKDKQKYLSSLNKKT